MPLDWLRSVSELAVIQHFSPGHLQESWLKEFDATRLARVIQTQTRGEHGEFPMSSKTTPITPMTIDE